MQISEYGAFYDYTELNNVPAGSVTAWYAPGSNVDGDLGPFKGLSEHTEGIYIAIKGSEDSTYREGIMVAYRADDTDKGIAYAHVQGSPGNGGIKYATDWMTINSGSSSGGITKLWEGELPLTNGAPEMLNFSDTITTGDRLLIVYNYSGFIGAGGVMTGLEFGRTFTYTVDTQGELTQSFYTIKLVSNNLQYGYFTLKISGQGPTAISMEAIGDDDSVINPFTVTAVYKM